MRYYSINLVIVSTLSYQHKTVNSEGMEKSVDWFAENSWSAGNNNFDKTNDRHGDTPDWFTEHSWPANTKYVDGKEEVEDSKKVKVTPRRSEDDNTPPDWFRENSWPPSTKCEKEEEKKSASDGSCLGQTGWSVCHQTREEATTQHRELVVQDQKARTQSCCSIL